MYLKSISPPPPLNNKIQNPWYVICMHMKVLTITYDTYHVWYPHYLSCWVRMIKRCLVDKRSLIFI